MLQTCWKSHIIVLDSKVTRLDIFTPSHNFVHIFMYQTLQEAQCINIFVKTTIGHLAYQWHYEFSASWLRPSGNLRIVRAGRYWHHLRACNLVYEASPCNCCFLGVQNNGCFVSLYLPINQSKFSFSRTARIHLAGNIITQTQLRRFTIKELNLGWSAHWTRSKMNESLQTNVAI